LKTACFTTSPSVDLLTRLSKLNEKTNVASIMRIREATGSVIFSPLVSAKDPSLVDLFAKEMKGMAMPVYRCIVRAKADDVGNAGKEYMEKYGAVAEDFAEIARVNHEHSKRNPYSQFTDEYSLEQIMNSPMIHAPLTKLQCCPTSDGGAAVVVVSQEFLDKRPDLKSQAILIADQQLATDSPDLFSRSAIDLVGFQMSVFAGKRALDEAGITPDDVSVVEVHDCFSANEMCVIDALGLSPKGKAQEMVRNGDITYGGKYVINPSGGLISKGHPLGATGLAQCAELTWHLRGWANNRLVKDTKYCLQHNLGLGGAVVVTVYKRADGKAATSVSDEQVGKINGLGYNPATQAKGFTSEQVRRAVSQKYFSDWAVQDVEAKVQARF